MAKTEQILLVKGSQNGRLFTLGSFEDNELGHDEAEACAMNNADFDDIRIYDAEGRIVFECESWVGQQ